MANKKVDYKKLAEQAARVKKESEKAAQETLEEAIKSYFNAELSEAEEDEELDDVEDGEELTADEEEVVEEAEEEELDLDIEDDEEVVEEEEFDDEEFDDEEIDLDIEDDEEVVEEEEFDDEEEESALESVKKANKALEDARLMNAKTKALSVLFTKYTMSESIYRKTLKKMDTANTINDVKFIFSLVKENLEPKKINRKKVQSASRTLSSKYSKSKTKKKVIENRAMKLAGLLD